MDLVCSEKTERELYLGKVYHGTRPLVMGTQYWQLWKLCDITAVLKQALPVTPKTFCRLPDKYHKVLVRLREGYLALMKAEGNCSSIWVLEGGEGEGGVTVVEATTGAVQWVLVPCLPFEPPMHHLVPASNPVSGGT